MAGPNKLDSRQIVSRDTLSQIFPNANNQELDDLLRSINSDLTPPYRLDASATPDLTVSVGSSDIANAISGRNKASPFAGKVLPSLSSGSVVFPASSGGTITITPGTDAVLTVSSGNYIKCTIYINAISEIGIVLGAEAATEAGATVAPAPANTIPVGYIVLHNTTGTVDNIEQSAIFQFGSGAGSGSGAAGGLGSDLGDLAFRASFEDSFTDSDLIEESKTTALNNVSSEAYDIAYDTNGSGGSLSAFAGASTNITWTGTPNFTVVIGDVVFAKIGANLEVRRITAVTSQTDVTVESAFSANVNTATYCGVSQTVQTVDMVNYYDDADPESLRISQMLGHIALTNISGGASDSVDHSEQPSWLTPAINDIVLKDVSGTLYETYVESITDSDTFVLADTTGFGSDGDGMIIRPLTSYCLNYLDDGLVADINVAAQVITKPDLSANWAAENGIVRKQNYQDILTENTVSSAGAHFYARFFANKDAGKGTVKIYGYQAFFYAEPSTANGGIFNQLYCRADGSGTEINCTVNVVSGKARVTLADGWTSFVPAINPGKPEGELRVYMDGKRIPRYVDATLTPSTYYTEDSSGKYIEFDTDYSATPYEICVLRELGTIDTSDENAALLAHNHLGSTDASVDKSVAGRGILLRNAAGTLVEITLDADNNIQIESV